MTQSQQNVSLAAGSAILEWSIAAVALAREPVLERPVSSGQMEAVRAAWRCAERCLGDHLEAGPDRDRLKAQVIRLRARYDLFFEAAAGTVHDAAVSATR